jgi:hypothetical protein
MAKEVVSVKATASRLPTADRTERVTGQGEGLDMYTQAYTLSRQTGGLGA